MESKKTNLKEKSKFFEKYSTGYNIIRDVVILVSIFFVFYYQDCFYSVYNLSLNELDFNLKYLIYKATIGLITYGFIFTIYLYSVENLSNSNGKKDFWKSFILFFFLLWVLASCVIYIVFSVRSWKSIILSGLILGFIFSICSLVASSVSLSIRRKLDLNNNNSRKHTKKFLMSTELMFFFVLVIFILIFIKFVAKDAALDKKDFKIIPEKQQIVLFENFSTMIVTNYDIIETKETTEIKREYIVNQDLTNKTESKEIEIKDNKIIEFYTSTKQVIDKIGVQTEIIHIKKLNRKSEYIFWGEVQ